MTDEEEILVDPFVLEKIDSGPHLEALLSILVAITNKINNRAAD